jgi:hypothetical protein
MHLFRAFLNKKSEDVRMGGDDDEESDMTWRDNDDDDTRNGSKKSKKEKSSKKRTPFLVFGSFSWTLSPHMLIYTILWPLHI